MKDDFIISCDDLILITGSNGFVGSKVIQILLSYGFSHLRCFARPSSDLTSLNEVITSFKNSKVEIIKGNLLSVEDCKKATEGVSVVLHLAAGIEKSFAGSFMNSVLTTRNLLDGIVQGKTLKRFLNVSSFAVYSNFNIKKGGMLDETSEVEKQLVERCEAYTFGKVKQDELVIEYGRKYNIPYVIVRPCAVYGPGKSEMTSRVGIDTFGIFMHLGGSNRIPLTYVENCAEAIMLAGTKKGVDGETFNIVDDDLPTSRDFLKMYKKNVKHFKSIYIPYRAFYVFCYLWERYSKWSKGQLAPVFNRRRCAAYWKGNQYSNKKLKDLLGWQPRISFDEAAKEYFEYCRVSGEKK
jgi:nucleoside-diphosphate-sugar epimerase